MSSPFFLKLSSPADVRAPQIQTERNPIKIIKKLSNYLLIAGNNLGVV